MLKIIALTFLFLILFLAACGTGVDPELTTENPNIVSIACDYFQEVTITWQFEREALGFLINRKTADGEYTIIDSVSGHKFEFVDSDLTIAETYSYRIAAVTLQGNSNWSMEESIYVKTGFSELDFGEENSLEVVTWNIESFPKNNNLTIEYLVDLIPSIDADIFCLQEIESANQFEELIDELDNYNSNWAGIRMDSALYDVNLAVIYNADHIQVTAVTELFSDGDYDREFPRLPMLIEFFWNGIELFLINNHLKAMGDGFLNLKNPWDEETRRFDACNLLYSYISQNLDDEKVIVVGDYNDSLIDTNENNVFSIFLENIEEFYFADLEIAESQISAWSYPSWPSHLDHILITNELFDEFGNVDSNVQTFSIDVYLDGGWNEYDENISDHRQVGIKLVF